MGSELNNLNIKKVVPSGSGLVLNGGATGGGISDPSQIKIDMTPKAQETLEQKCQRLGITLDQYNNLKTEYPDFDTLDNEEQLRIVKQKYQEVKPESETDAAGASLKVVKGESLALENGKFSKAKYNSLSNDQKFAALSYEIGRNIYNSKYINNASQGVTGAVKSWEELTTEERENFIKEIEDNRKNKRKTDYPLLDNIIISKANQQADTEDGQRVRETDRLMLSVQAANRNNMSLQDFLNLDATERVQHIRDLLESESKERELSQNEIKYLSFTNDLKNEYINSLKKYGIHFSADASFEEIARCARNYNITYGEKFLSGAKGISDGENWTSQGDRIGISEHKQSMIDGYADLFENGGGAARDIISKAKAASFIELENKFNTLQQKVDAGQTLSAKEQQDYQQIKQYLESNDAQELKNSYVNKIPKPQNDYERSVVNDVNNIHKEIQASFNDDKRAEANFILNYIEQQTKGMSSREEKLKYIDAFLKFNNDFSSIEILRQFKNEYPELLTRGYLVSEMSGIAADETTTDAEFEAIVNTRNQYAASGGDLERSIAGRAALTTNNGLMRSTSPALDNRKVASSTYNTQLAEMLPDEMADKVMKSTVDTNTTIQDAARQLEAEQVVQKSKAYTDNVAIHELDVLEKFHEQNRFPIFDTSTAKSPAVVAYAADAKHKIVSKLGKDDQVRGFDLLKGRINDNFEGDDLIKYLNGLSDQIQDCDSANQLEMHNIIMDSPPEVQAHAAGNIQNYDPSVRVDAYNSALNSDNPAVVEAALSSLQNEIPEIQNAVLKPEIEDAVNELINSGVILSDNQYNALTDKQKEEYFRSLSPAKRIALVSSLKDISTKKAIIKRIAQNSPSCLKQLIDNDAKIAELTYNIGIMQDYIRERAEFKAEGNNDYRNLLEYIEKEEAKKYTDFLVENPATARTVEYASIPNTFNSENFEMFKRDRSGHLLG